MCVARPGSADLQSVSEEKRLNTDTADWVINSPNAQIYMNAKPQCEECMELRKIKNASRAEAQRSGRFM